MADIKNIKVTVDPSAALPGLTAITSAGQQAQSSLNGVNAALGANASASNSATVQGQKYLAQLQKQIDAIGKTKAELMQMRANQLGVGTDAESMIAKIKAATEAQASFAHGSNAANRELLVLAHELSQGNFSRFGGSLLVLGEQTNALGKAFSLLSAGGGLVGVALAALVAGILTVGNALIQQSIAVKNFNTNLALTNNIAGLTETAFIKMADTVENRTGRSFSTVSDSLLLVQKSGLYTGQQIQSLGQIIVKQAQLSGDSIEDTAKAFEKLALGPSKWVEEFNRSAHIFTPAQQQIIHDLEAQGNSQAAVTEALKVFTAYQNGPAKSAIEANLSIIQKIGIGWAYAGEQIAKYFAVTSKPLPQQLLEVNAQIKSKQLSGDTGETQGVDAMGDNTGPVNEYQDLLNKRSQILKTMAEQDAKSTAQAANALYSSLAQEGNQYIESLGIKTKKGLEDALAKLKKEIKDAQVVFAGTTIAEHKDSKTGEVIPQVDGVRSQLLDPAYQAQAEAAIRERFSNPLDTRALKQNFEEAIQLRDEYIKAASDATKKFVSEEQTQVDLGTKNQLQAFNEEQAENDADIEKEKKFVQDKINLAIALAKATNNKEGVNQAAQYRKELAALNSQEEDDDAAYVQKKAAYGKSVSAILSKMEEDITKSRRATQSAFQKQINSLFLSSNEADLQNSKDVISDKYKNLRDSISNEYKQKGASGTADEINALKELDKAEAEDLKTAQDNWSARLQAQTDWKDGAVKALKDYGDAARNVASTANKAMTSILDTLSESLANFFTTGKFGFKDLVDNIEKQLARVAANQVVGLLTDILTNGSSSGSSTGSLIGSLFGSGHAGGGDVSTSKIYPVGENGPEMFVPKVPGTIVNKSQLQAITGNMQSQRNITYAPTIDMSGIKIGGGVLNTKQDLIDFSNAIERKVKTAMVNERGFNGVLENR